MTPWRIIEGDCRDVLPTLPEASIDAVVTDPPYNLLQASRKGSGRSNNPDSPAGRHGARGGFMGMAWDASGVAFDPATWSAVSRAMKPGAHLLAFGGTRTYHRMVCAIEDAGLEIRDCVMWLYGSGYAKWHGALKPAYEPIVIARKPLAERSVGANVLRYGTGALNIAATLTPFADEDDEREAKGKNRHGDFGSVPPANVVYGLDARQKGNYDAPGRWPANIVLDGDAAALVGPPARFFYTAKVDREERERGLDGMSPGVLRWSAGEQNPGSFQSPGTNRSVRNHHPTVKPVSLLQWLCRLATPPGGTILDVFAGSGSTGIAALRDGFGFVGIELRADYCEIARRRIAGDMPLLNRMEDPA